ncbi:MAG: DUF3168 domain-containing protein [Pseudomonadota bacterium]
MLSNDLHAAIITALRGDAALTALIASGSGVIDAMPSKRAFPFVLFAQSETVPRNTDDCPGNAHTLTFDSWSRAENRREVTDICERITRVLTEHSWTAAETHVVLVTALGTTHEHMRDDRAYMTRLRFRMLTEPTDI